MCSLVDSVQQEPLFGSLSWSMEGCLSISHFQKGGQATKVQLPTNITTILYVQGIRAYCFQWHVRISCFEWPLCDCNSGFRKNDSTINRLLALLDSIYKGLEEHKDVILILLDISKAFDKVWHPGLLHKIKQLGFSGNLYNWIESYLSNRRQRVVVGGKSSQYLPTFAGVPQGSILGPLLFLIFINDMTTDLQLECHQYADDTTLVYRTATPTVMHAYITNQLSILSRWAELWRVTFNALKTHYMYFTNKHIGPAWYHRYFRGHISHKLR